MLKAMLALLQGCCKQRPKEPEELFHVGLSNTAAQGDILPHSELRVLQLLPQGKGRAVTAELKANYSSYQPKFSQYLHLLLVHCTCPKESLNLPLQKVPRAEQTLPCSSECRALARAKLAALQRCRHICSEASVIDAH